MGTPRVQWRPVLIIRHHVLLHARQRRVIRGKPHRFGDGRVSGGHGAEGRRGVPREDPRVYRRGYNTIPEN